MKSDTMLLNDYGITQTRLNWLKSLNVGDEVCLCTFEGPSAIVRYFCILKITNITVEKGLEVADRDYAFDYKGFWYYIFIMPVTQEAKDEIEKQDILNDIKWTEFNEFSLDQLRKIIAIIKE